MAKCSKKHIFDNTEKLSKFAAEFIVNTANAAIADRGIFTLGVSGGSIINLLATQLADNASVQWGKWKIFFCDERLTSFSNSDSTYGLFKEKLIDKVGHNDSWVPINPDLPVNECAADYEKKMREIFVNVKFPEFDLLLLGMGPDGHTCSLFPGHKLLQEDQLWIAPIDDSPKPPPCRVTMTLPVLNHARNVAFISAGSSKADTIKQYGTQCDTTTQCCIVLLYPHSTRIKEKNFQMAVFTPTEDESARLPAARVAPISGNLYWIMDEGAASKL